MSKRSIVAGLIATVALAAALAGTANARRIAFTEQRFLSHFSGFQVIAGAMNIECPASLEGSFHSKTIAKVQRSLIGYITEVRFKRPCRNGQFWARTTQEGRPETLPWHILYEKFIGALPNILEIEITIDNLGIVVESVGVVCLYLASTTEPAKAIIQMGAGGRISTLTMNGAPTIPLHEGPFCSMTASLHGSGIYGRQSDYREVFVSLVQ
jgi:hypothetical protein